MITSSSINSRQSGMIIVVVLFVLMMLASFGLLYFKTSRDKMSEAFMESEKIKARALARAGFEKGVVLVRDRYKKAHYKWRYPDQGANVVAESEFKGLLGEGGWRIDRISSFVYRPELAPAVGPYEGIPYVLFGTQKGIYDVLQIDSTGKMAKSGVEVSITGLVKMIREDVQY